MKMKLNKLFLMVILVFCFFVGLNNAEAKETKICSYTIEANGVDIDSGSVTIFYDSSNQKFRFVYSLINGDKNYGLTEEYSEETGIKCTVSASNLNQTICKSSNDGKNKDVPYVRFEGFDIKLLKNKRQCPKYVDYTAELWKDDAGKKRICFSDYADKCASKLEKTWDDYKNNKSWAASYEKNKRDDKAAVGVTGNSETLVGDAITDCKSITSTAFYKQLQKFFSIIKIATPILTIVLIMKDMVSAVVAGKDDDMKKAQKHAVIRLIVGVCIFLLPTLINVIVSLVDEVSGGTCGIK